MSFLFFSKGSRFVVLKGKKEGISYNLALIFLGGSRNMIKIRIATNPGCFFHIFF